MNRFPGALTIWLLNPGERERRPVSEKMAGFSNVSIIFQRAMYSAARCLHLTGLLPLASSFDSGLLR